MIVIDVIVLFLQDYWPLHHVKVVQCATKGQYKKYVLPEGEGGVSK